MVRRHIKKVITCPNCGRQLHPFYSSLSKFCSNKCQQEYRYKSYIERWKEGKESGTKSEIAISRFVRRYLFEKFNNKCQLCGWGEVNKFTNKIPLQIHHIDGNCKNNKEDNLQLLCPNCHSLTENFGSRNKNAPAERSKYYGKGKVD